MGGMRRLLSTALSAFLLFFTPASAAVSSRLETYDGSKFVPVSTTTGTGISFTAPLIIAPGNYSYNGSVWVVPEGLLSIFAADPVTNYNDGGYRYVWNGDVEKFIEGIAYLFQTGVRDNGLSVAAAESLMRLRKLGMTCGNTTLVVRDLFAQIGVQTRTVHFLTAEVPVTGFDDGHVALEAYLNNKWVYIDFDLKDRFVKSDGTYASLANIIDTGVSHLTEEVISQTEFYQDDYSPTKFRSAVYGEQVLLGANRATWQARVYQIPAIDWAGGIVNGQNYPAGIYAFMPTGTESRTSYVQSAGYTVVSRAVWNAMFYP